MRGQGIYYVPCRGVTARCVAPFQRRTPLLDFSNHSIEITTCQVGRLGGRVCEPSDPWHNRVAAEVGESCDVPLASARQHHADGGHVRRRESPSLEDYVDQGPTGAAIPVGEGMNRLELRMDQCCLHDWRKCVVIYCLAEIRHEIFDLVRRRRHKTGTARIVVVATNPVLFIADFASDTWCRAGVHQALMNGQDIRHCEPLIRNRLFDCQLHAVDTGDNLTRSRSYPFTRIGTGFCACKRARTKLKPFYL